MGGCRVKSLDPVCCRLSGRHQHLKFVKIVLFYGKIHMSVYLEKRVFFFFFFFFFYKIREKGRKGPFISSCIQYPR